jgi:TonB family protein
VPEERKVVVDTGLPREVILAVVKRHQSELRFCFEQQAQKNPALAGKVAVAFTIDPSGAVADAAVSETSLDDANVEACMLARIRRWRFPEPKNGGTVGVNFPWVFKVAGDD